MSTFFTTSSKNLIGFPRNKDSVKTAAIAQKVAAATSIIHHPRSLARPAVSWRPPQLKLPAQGKLPALTMTILRRHVSSPIAKKYHEQAPGSSSPAYLIEARFTMDQDCFSQAGTTAAAWWLTRIATPGDADWIHCVQLGNALLAYWLVDGSFTPIAAPENLITGFSKAA